MLGFIVMFDGLKRLAPSGQRSMCPTAVDDAECKRERRNVSTQRYSFCSTVVSGMIL